MKFQRLLSLIWLPLFGALAFEATKISAQETATVSQPPLVFDGSTTTLTSSHKLRVGHYTGLRGTLIVDGGKDRRCILEIPEGCVIEELKLQIRTGSELSITGALLRRCQIYAEPKSTIIISDSGLDQCELNGLGDNTKGFPSLKLMNCAMASGGFLRAVNALGVDAQDCVLLNIKSQTKSPKTAVMGGSTFATQARSPRFRYTTFRDCYLPPTVFYTVSQCTFESCTTPSTSTTSAAPPSAEDVILPIRWVACTPETAPKLGGGVSLQAVTTPIPGGCSLKYTYEGAKLSLTNVQQSSTAAPITAVLPNAEGTTTGAPMVAASTDTGAVKVKLKQAHMNALVVSTLDSGRHAGGLSKMHLITLPGPPAIRFNQDVGDEMMTGLREVEKLMRIRHSSLPVDVEMEIGFDDKYSSKDGGSASVGIGLMIESVITGKVMDPSFAVTGDINADGSVQPIGGVAAKIRGATNGSCKLVAIPAKNEPSVGDVLLLDGPAPLAGIAIFSITTFDEAVNFASMERPPAVQQAVTEMETIRAVLQRNPAAITQILRNPAAATRLQAVLDKAPNCLSAKYLLLYAQGRGPTTLTMAGSMQAVSQAGAALMSSKIGVPDQMRPEDIGGCLNQLRNLRPKTDKRVWPFIDAMVNFGDFIREVMRNPSMRDGSRISATEQKRLQLVGILSAAESAINSDASIREDLMR